MAVAALSAGLLQLSFRRAYRGEQRTAIRLPWRLWIAVACFVIYGLVWPCALASSSSRQVGGVNLINYLWPVLTVLLGAWWVPGLRLTWRMGLSVALAFAGLLCANIRPLREMLSSRPGAAASIASVWIPYTLACVAAVTWAIYSALLARWRTWAGHYVTSPIGLTF